MNWVAWDGVFIKLETILIQRFKKKGKTIAFELYLLTLNIHANFLQLSTLNSQLSTLNT